MEEIILITYLNDFIFCPVSIYFSRMYGEIEKNLYKGEKQINGIAAHKSIDSGEYSTSSNILQGISVFCEKYGILGKIDLFDISKKTIVERKNKITEIYDGYIFQVYAQYFSLLELGYEVDKIKFYSFSDNKSYNVLLPKDDKKMFEKFEKIIEEIRLFKMDNFKQSNIKKCENCIYEPSCDRSLIC